MKLLTLAVLMTGLSACGPYKRVYKDIHTGAEKTKYSIPVKGQCVQMSDTLWVENEGDHADIYGNDKCKHIGGPTGVICNNLNEDDDEVCWINGDMYVIHGEYASMEMYVITF